MRPVNLIPVEERRGEHAPMRSGPLVYIVIGALVAALAGVTALVLTGNEIADSKAEVTQLRQEDAAVKARAQKLAAYTQFRALRDQRVATVTSLADSRFDWERVMRELSLVLPPDVWLTNLTATSAPGVSAGSGSSGGESESSASGMRGSIAGPAIEMAGCANGQDGVAGFVTALKDIDGVTRVGVQSSALPETGSGAGAGAEEDGSGAGGSTDCRTRGFIAEFQIVVAFDAAPIPAGASGAEEAAPVAPVGESSESSTESTESTATSPEG
jgi:Tfp pilus assembly protein PilN